MTSGRNANPLAGSLLVASPALEGVVFRRSVIVLCVHSAEGALGVVVNQRKGDTRIGGPVMRKKTVVLHSDDYSDGAETIAVPPDLALTTGAAVLADIARGAGPERHLALRGHAGWAPGQLDAELRAGVWLPLPASRRVVFDTPEALKWSAALSENGIDPAAISGQAGRA